MALYFPILVEILMDLVDLNMLSSPLLVTGRGVEILMDLVDLNCSIYYNLSLRLSRDPYGSRGSKSSTFSKLSASLSRDPYGSRGSKYPKIHHY